MPQMKLVIRDQEVPYPLVRHVDFEAFDRGDQLVALQMFQDLALGQGPPPSGLSGQMIP
jgi:hypothetical protein